MQGCEGEPFGNSPPVQFKTTYQAVFLDNGQVFFGKIENAESRFPLLRDVYYVQRVEGTEEDKGQVKSMLIKRGSEWHGPDLMYLNSQHIVLIEPVDPDSRVAELIREVNAE